MTTQKRLDDGTVAQGVVMLSDDGSNAMPAPLFQQDLIGNAHGHYPNYERGFVFGKRTGIGNVFVDLWGGPTGNYVFPIAPIQMRVVSTSASDAVNGVGIRTIHIHYLDGEYRIKEAIVNLNGLSPGAVTAEIDIFRINSVHATDVGSGGYAVGDISITNLAGTITYGFINSGNNTARQAIYTVPGDYWGYINHWQQSSGSSGAHFAQIALRATCHDGQRWPGVFLIQDEQGSQNGGDVIAFPIPIPIPPKTDVKISAISDAPNANVTALGAIMGWFEPI